MTDALRADVDRLKGELLFSKPDGDLVAHLIVDLARDGDATRFRRALDARRYVDAVTHQVVALHNDIADVNPDAQRQRILDSLGATDCLDCASELNQEPVTHCLEQTACLAI